MTNAPPELMKVRNFIINNMHVRADRVGIVGGPSHVGGYHCGSDRTITNDYSVVESDRDRKGLNIYASALDIGEFSYEGMNLRHFSLWLVERCKRGTLDTANIREVIYTPDGKTVLRWDRLKKRKSGDDTHLWHTHISYYRDSSNSTKNLALYQLYVEETMSVSEDVWNEDIISNLAERPDFETNPTVTAKFAVYDTWSKAYRTYTKVMELAEEVAAIKPNVYIQLTDAQFAEYLNRIDNGE